MTLHSRFSCRLLAFAVASIALLLASACGGGRSQIPEGIEQADRFLFERGTEALENRRWYSAREYFARIVDNYPQSPHRPDAKLGVADAFLGEGTTEALVMAANEYKEFLTFYPTNRRADYAQYKLGMVHHRQMRGPERDQTETREAIREFETFIERYPNSELMPEARQRLREARDRLSTSEYRVGYFYYRQRWYPGAISRLRALLQYDPEFTNRDAAYYYLGESLLKANLAAEALPYFDRLVKEFDTSEYLDRAQKRLAEFQSLTPADATQPASAAPDSQPPSPGVPPTPPPETAKTTPAGSTPAPAPPPQ